MPLRGNSKAYTLFNAGLKQQYDDRLDDAKDSYREAMQKGCIQAAVNLGTLMVDGTDADKMNAKETFQWAADRGDGSGCRNLAYMYAIGLCVPKDKEKAVEYYRKAAELGNIKAQCNLAVMYRHGNGTPIDYEQAAEWYKRSAEGGYFRAQASLADMYLLGQGVERDPEKAFYWYTKAADNGSSRGMYNLALMYLNGVYTDKDEDKAAGLLNAAIQQGYSKAMFVMGQLLEDKGCMPEAMNLYLSGAAKKEPRCVKRLEEFGYGADHNASVKHS